MKNYISQLLNDYLNDKSDNSPMEASEQEDFENGFKDYLDDIHIEQDIIEQLNKMAEKSLPPNIHNYYVVVLKHLCKNTRNLIVTKEHESEYDKAIALITEDGLKVLRVLMQDSGTTPDWDDVLNIAGIQ